MCIGRYLCNDPSLIFYIRLDMIICKVGWKAGVRREIQLIAETIWIKWISEVSNGYAIAILIVQWIYYSAQFLWWVVT